MTLHLSFLSENFVVVVGDRLLTTASPEGRTPWDPYANKTILVLADNGIVAVSYAGLAHIGSRQTDEWLLRVIAGLNTGELDGDNAVGMNIRPVTVRLGPMLDAIGHAVNSDFLSQSLANRKNGMTILVQGFTWTRRARFTRSPIRSFGAELTHSGSRTEAAVWDRWPPTLVGVPLSTYGMGVIGTGTKAAATRTRLAVTDNVRRGVRLSPDVIEAVLTTEVRTQAQISPGIGTELMSVVIQWPGPSVRIKYLRTPESAHQAFGPSLVASGGANGDGMILFPPLIGGGGEFLIQVWGIEIPFQVEPAFAPSSLHSFGSYLRP